jgi:hypothetical protein
LDMTLTAVAASACIAAPFAFVRPQSAQMTSGNLSSIRWTTTWTEPPRKSTIVASKALYRCSTDAVQDHRRCTTAWIFRQIFSLDHYFPFTSRTPRRCDKGLVQTSMRVRTGLHRLHETNAGLHTDAPW